MIVKGIPYQFTAKSWKYAGSGSWHFVSLPPEKAMEIRGFLKSEHEGWGRLPATAKIGTTEWKTAIWFDTKMSTYLLPLKAEVRKKEGVIAGGDVDVILWI